MQRLTCSSRYKDKTAMHWLIKKILGAKPGERRLAGRPKMRWLKSVEKEKYVESGEGKQRE